MSPTSVASVRPQRRSLARSAAASVAALAFATALTFAGASAASADEAAPDAAPAVVPAPPAGAETPAPEPTAPEAAPVSEAPVDAGAVAEEPDVSSPPPAAATQTASRTAASTATKKTYYSVAIYLYQKLDPTKPAAWENSGLQTLLDYKDGTEWFTEFPPYGELPEEVCGTGWGFQQDKVATTDPYFQWPMHIEYPDDNIGWPPLYDAKHQELSELIDVPDCDPVEVIPGDPSGSVAQCVDGTVTTGSITVGGETGLVYTITGTGAVSHIVIDPVTSTVTTGLPVGSYIVSVTALPGYTLSGPAEWPITVEVAAPVDCVPTQVIPGDPSGSVAQCVDGTVTTGSITVGGETGLVYTITGTGAVSHIVIDPVTSTVTTGLPVGSYIVSVTALPGYTLSGPAEWPITVEVAVPVDCVQLPDHAQIPTNATVSPQVCSTTDGSIVLGQVDGVSFFEGVTYFIDGVEAPSWKVARPAGTYVVTVVPDAGNTLEGPDTFILTVPAAGAVCGDLTTLALTGSSPEPWLPAAIALLLAGAIAVAAPRIRARRFAEEVD